MKISIKNISFSFSLLCFLMLSSITYAAAPAYKLVDLGIQESDQSEAVAVNDNGQVAGAYWILGKKHYFLWNEQEGITLIDLPETATIVVLNNIGQIAGNYKDVAGHDRGFLWDPSCGICDIGTLGGNFTRIYDMNDLGQIVGESESKMRSLVDKQSEVRAFLWQCFLMSDLGALVGDLGLLGDRSQAAGINNQGHIIGVSNTLALHKGKCIRMNDRAVLWKDGLIEDIDSGVEAQYSAQAMHLNDNGLSTYKNNAQGVFLFDLMTAQKKAIPFAHSHQMVSVSNDGDIFVGGGINKAEAAYFKKASAKFGEAGQENYDYLNFSKVMNAAISDFTYWKRNSFYGANFNNSRWIIGVASNIYGETHAVLLVPVTEQVEPSEPIDEIPSEEPKAEEPKISLGTLIADRKKLNLSGQALTQKVLEAIQAGADVNDDTRNGHRPLQLAIKGGYDDVARLLIENGADVNYRDRSGSDPIHLAVNCGCYNIAKLLIKYGVPFNSHTCSPKYKYTNWYHFVCSLR